MQKHVTKPKNLQSLNFDMWWFYIWNYFCSAL